MKGPYERLKYDLRRQWECPDCSHRELTDGTVVVVHCRCPSKKEPVIMKLVSDGPRRVERSSQPQERPASKKPRRPKGRGRGRNHGGGKPKTDVADSGKPPEVSQDGESSAAPKNDSSPSHEENRGEQDGGETKET